MLHKGQMMTSILTPTGNPGYLTLSCLKLILHNVRRVIMFCLRNIVKILPLNQYQSQNTHLSHAVKAPMVISIVVLIMLSHLERRSHKLNSNSS